MTPFEIFAVVLALAGTATSLAGGISAQKNAEVAAEAQRIEADKAAIQLEQQGAEQKRRDRLANLEINSENLKRAAASGVQVSGSVSAHLNKVKKEQQAELAWLDSSVVSNSSLARQRGRNAAGATEARGDTALWQGIGGAASSLAGYANTQI